MLEGLRVQNDDYEPCDSPYNQSPEEKFDDIVKFVRIVYWAGNGIATSFFNASEVTRLAIVILGALSYDYYTKETYIKEDGLPVQERGYNRIGINYGRNTSS